MYDTEVLTVPERETQSRARGGMAGEHKFNKEFQKRLFDARKRMELLIGEEVTLQRIANGIGEILREPAPYFTTVGKWMQGVEPSLSRQTWALAKFFGVDPGDLLFGGSPGNRPMPLVPKGRSGLPPKRYQEQEVEVPANHARKKPRRRR